MLRRIFVPKRNEKTRESYISFTFNVLMLRRLHLLGWMAGHAALTREMRSKYKILIGKPEGKR
jgi:hypothetical protein